MRRIGEDGECGSALMLVPAGLLVVLILAAISVDSSIAFMGQRELLNQTAAAANDAATEAIPPDQLQRGDQAGIDDSRTAEIAEATLQRVSSSGLHVTGVTTSVDAATHSVRVFAEGDVDTVFAKAIPGASSRRHVTATSTAVARFRQL